VETVLHAGSEAGGALGAARLAWLAAGGDEATVCTKPAVASRYIPRTDRQAALHQRLQRFRATYRQLQPSSDSAR
jgi:xylulokinase